MSLPPNDSMLAAKIRPEKPDKQAEKIARERIRIRE
jgi:hypothetical protein